MYDDVDHIDFLYLLKPINLIFYPINATINLIIYKLDLIQFITVCGYVYYVISNKYIYSFIISSYTKNIPPIHIENKVQNEKYPFFLSIFIKVEKICVVQYKILACKSLLFKCRS